MKSFLQFFTIILLFSNNFLNAQNSILSTSILKQKLDSIVTLESNNKVEFYYNQFGEDTCLINFTWSNTSMSWEANTKKVFVYLKNLCVSELTYSWDKALKQWLIISKQDKSYDEKNQLLLSNYYTWNITESKWALNNKTDYVNTYNSKNKLVSTILYINQISSPQVEKRKYDFTYNSNDDLTSVSRVNWENSSWSNYRKNEFIYEGRNIIRVIYYHWNPGVWFPDNNSHYLVVSNNTYPIEQVLIPANYIYTINIFPTDFKPNFMVTSVQETSGLWLKRYYYSSMEITGLNNESAIKTNIFPNPATDYLNIQWNGINEYLNVELIETTGKVVLKERVNNYSRISVQNFPAGVYLLKISNNITFQTIEIIIN